MTTFRIENTISAVILGEYEAATEAEALDAMARDAGHSDYASACEAAPVKEGEIIVTPIITDDELTEWWCNAETAGDSETMLYAMRALGKTIDVDQEYVGCDAETVRQIAAMSPQEARAEALRW